MRINVSFLLQQLCSYRDLLKRFQLQRQTSWRNQMHQKAIGHHFHLHLDGFLAIQDRQAAHANFVWDEGVELVTHRS